MIRSLLGSRQDTEEDEEELETLVSKGGRLRHSRSSGRASAGLKVDHCENAVEAVHASYIVSCPCGVRHDDGQMMIECEDCKCWAHVNCLQMLVGLLRGVVL